MSYQYPGWHWDGTQWQRVQPVKKRHTALIVVLSTLGGVLLLCLVVGIVAVVASDDTETGTDGTFAENVDAEATNGGEETQGTGDSAGEEDTAQEELPPVGRDGQFEFTVVEVEAGVDEVNAMPDNQFSDGEQAQGEFVLATVEVENIGDTARTFSDFNQYAYDANGRQFSADTGAGWEANGGTDVWLTEINPGNSITGILVFDVPPDTELVKLKLHDSSLSGGVEVGLP